MNKVMEGGRRKVYPFSLVVWFTEHMIINLVDNPIGHEY